MEELFELLNQYKQFHLYVDDAHGMSSFGKNGTGYVLNKVDLHPKMILATAMGKAFGTIGGIFVVPDEHLCSKIRNCAGPLIFSSQQAIPVLGASIASAKIHLSEEIKVKQALLAEKISHCHNLLKKYNLPDISAPDTPVFFVALGLIRVGHNIVKRMMEDGYFLNLAVFPAVPETCTGIRFTITLHLSFEDIENMVKALAYHFSKVLEAENRNIIDIQRAFRKVANLEGITIKTDPPKSVEQPYRIQHETTIEKIPAALWEKLFGKDVSFNYIGLKFLEETFKDNLKPEHNWSFHYYLVFDQRDEPILATFFTITTIKDDMLSPIAISKQIETVRDKNPYYLTSRAMVMGSLLTDGDYLYLNRSANWNNAFLLLLNEVAEEQEKQEANMLLLRDFHTADTEIMGFLTKQGFIKMILPDTHVIENKGWKTEKDFLDGLNQKKRQYVKTKVFKYEPLYTCEILSGSTQDEIARWYNLFENVRQKNFEVNSFGLPSKFFENIGKQPDWEVIQLHLNSTTIGQEKKIPVAIMICLKTDTRYFPMFVGMDYQYLETHNIYPQILWQTIKRAGQLNAMSIPLGLTASQNKRKFGAKAIPQFAYVQMRDYYNTSLIGLMANKE
jgi:predicted N-acyltransferase